MYRFLTCLIIASGLPACTAITALSAIPGALVEAAANQLTGEEESFPVSVHTTLAATQICLHTMKLDIDLVEIQHGKDYAIAFSNENLDGAITLTQQTAHLTTLNIKVRDITRQSSVERAIIDVIHEKLKTISRSKRFNSAGYHNIRAKPTAQSTRLGWFRPGARLEARRTKVEHWLMIKLPSGKKAYVKGEVRDKAVQ